MNVIFSLCSSSNLSKSSLIYQNVGYRRPPPVPPPDEDAPPALPPRNYRSYPSQAEPGRYRHGSESGRSDHSGVNDVGVEPSRAGKPRWEGQQDGHDNYAEQLRRQARRLSEQQQHMPTPMSYISSKVKINYSQSYKRLPVETLEATPPGVNSDHQVSPSFSPKEPQSPTVPPTQMSPTTSGHLTQTKDTSSNQIQPLNVEIQSEASRAPPTSPASSSWRPVPTLPSPEPPPPPTPQKEDLTHLAGADLPPPPPEVIDSGKGEHDTDK